MQKFSRSLSSENVVIRPAVEGDVARLIELERQTEAAAHWSEEQYSEIFLLGNPRRIILLAELGCVIAGFGVVQVIGNEGELENLVVRLETQRQGVGERLMRALIKAVQKGGVHNIFLEVRESNQAARALYNKLRFEEFGRRNRYYQNSVEDAILYRIIFRR